MAPYILARNLLDQFNHYRTGDILSRIKQCDSKMKLTDMCEVYTMDNHTYSIIRSANIEFQSLQNIYEILIDRLIVKKLANLCSPGQWCLGNISQEDIRFTMDIFRQRGRSFCALKGCHHRLTVHINTCPIISPKNTSVTTMKLLPMLCALYEEPQSSNSNTCMKQIVYLLHIFYAFWPQIETCHRIITSGSDGCTTACLTLDNLLHFVESQCSADASFLTRIPELAWYRLINLREECRRESIPDTSPFVSSVKNFISSNILWYRFHQRPIYAALFIIVVICIVISFSLCLYVMSKNDYESSNRHTDDDYEYTRLHDSTFELGASTEIPNSNLSSNNASAFDLRNHHHRSPEHQRLLYMES
ncbi:hypothetical protein I4U23_006445 [Adineta vaga]|nr:hypothetical protein I4U23_006445 [Adineta vaga]